MFAPTESWRLRSHLLRLIELLPNSAQRISSTHPRFSLQVRLSLNFQTWILCKAPIGGTGASWKSPTCCILNSAMVEIIKEEARRHELSLTPTPLSAKYIPFSPHQPIAEEYSLDENIYRNHDGKLLNLALIPNCECNAPENTEIGTTKKLLLNCSFCLHCSSTHTTLSSSYSL